MSLTLKRPEVEEQWKEDPPGPIGTKRDSADLPDSGALHITVPLGPANPYREYTAQGDAAGTKVYTTTVSIVPAA